MFAAAFAVRSFDLIVGAVRAWPRAATAACQRFQSTPPSPQPAPASIGM